MKKLLFLLIVVFAVPSLFAEFRIWESTDGNIWEGEFVTMNGPLVVIMDQPGKKTEYNPELLSRADQDYLEKIVTPSLNVDISRVTDSSSSGKSEKIHCVVSIKKSDTRKYEGELTAVLVLMAEELRTGAISKAGSNSEFKFTLPSKHGVAVEFKSDGITFVKRSNNSGRAYSGYVLVVWDRFGNPVAVKSNRDSYLENATKLARPKMGFK